MTQRASVSLSNCSEDALLVIVEPWAVEFMLPSRSFCEVFSVGGTAPSDIEVEENGYGFVFYINTAGAIYEYWQDGEFID